MPESQRQNVFPSPSGRGARGEGSKNSHGGRRVGSGGKPGNLNALKSGVHSRQVAALRIALETIPHTAGLVAEISRHDRGRTHLLAEVLRHSADLLELQAAGKRSSVEANNVRHQIQLLSKIAKTVKRSSDATLSAAHGGEQALTPDPWPTRLLPAIISLL